MRWSILAICVLLAGCSSPSSEPVAGSDAGAADRDPMADLSQGGVAATPPPRSEVLMTDDIMVTGSLSTGVELSPWLMGYRQEILIPRAADFTGLYLEIYWGPQAGGIAGGKAGFWAQDLPEDPRGAKTLGVAVAAGGESGAVWVDAETLASADDLQFTVAAADGPDHAVQGTASIAATAFFGGLPPEEYTALEATASPPSPQGNP